MVRGPREPAGAPLDHVVERLPCLEVPDPQGEELRAVLVDTPREPPVVPRVAAAPDAVVALAVRLRVAVEQDLFAGVVGAHCACSVRSAGNAHSARSARNARGVPGEVAIFASRGAADGIAGGVADRSSAHHRVLSSRAVAVVVHPCTVLRRNARIVLLDAPAELVEEGRAERLRGGERRVPVGVLRFEVLANVRAQHGGVAHHLLPVLVLEPGVVVGAAASVQHREGARLAGRDGRGR